MSRARTAPPVSLIAALFGRVGALFCVALVLVAGMAFLIAQRQINAIYDGQLIVGANVLQALMADEIREQAEHPRAAPPLIIEDNLLSAEDRKAFDLYADWRMFRVWRGGQVVLRSDTGPPLVAPPDRDGFSEVQGPHARWRLYTLSLPKVGTALQVGERVDIRHVLIRGVALELLVPFLLFVPALGLLMWWSLRDGLRTLRGLIDELGRRTARDLSPLPLEAWPQDLHPLIASINRLLERIEAAVRNERAFVDNAAHQLRTPLAAVKLQAQLIAGESDPTARQALSAALAEGVDRAAAMTNRLLTLAQLDSRAAQPTTPGDLREETVAAVEDLALMAERHGVALAFRAPRGPFPSGEPMLLRLVASNLIENAIKHSPDGGEVAVSLERSGQRHALKVMDAGPGIPREERSKVSQRFYRGRAAARSGGAGLGLSIAAESLRLLGGVLDFADRPDGRPGLLATAEIPARQPDAA